MTADEPVAGVPRLCARRVDCTRPRGHDDECGPDRADTELADLDAIKARFQQVTVDAPVQYAWHAETAIGYLVEYDVPMLVAEVLSLRARLAEAEGVARTNAAWARQQYAAAKEAREQRDALQRQVADLTAELEALR